MTLNGKLDLQGLLAKDLTDVRFMGAMSPTLRVSVGDVMRATPQHDKGGKNPQWHHTFPPWDLPGVSVDLAVKMEISDESGELIGRAQSTVGAMLTASSAAQGKGDQSIHLPVVNAKGKAHGELHLRVNWTPAVVAQVVPQPAQPQYVQSQQQQQPMRVAPQPPMQQGHAAAAPMAQAPAYSAPPAYVQSQPVPMYMGPQPMVPQYYPQPGAQPQGYMQPQPMMQQQPQIYSNVPAYAPGAYPPQQGYSPGMQQMSPAVAYAPSYPPMHAAPAPYYAGPSSGAPSAVVLSPQHGFQPSASNADGIFPFSELTITRMIGDGTFGTVSAGEFRSTPCAIKQLKQAVFSPAQWTEFMEEVKFLREARHPNIVLFMGVSFNPYCIVTELLDTSLFNVLHKEKRVLTPAQQAHIALGIARGLASLHANAVPIVHRDIKSLNILVSNDLTAVKICDLGMVKLKAAAGTRLESNGTPLWMAPEVLLDQPYDEQADVYSFGCVLFEILTGSVPFGGGNISKADLVARVGQRGERPQLPSGMIPPMKQLLVQCWQHHPQSRPTMKAVVATLGTIKL